MTNAAEDQLGLHPLRLSALPFFRSLLDVQLFDASGVGLDEALPGSHHVTHQGVEDVVGL